MSLKQNSNQELVSIVIICFNQGKFLDDAIASCFAQTGYAPEIVIVNDGSTDQTADVALAHPDISYVFQRNQGISAARNAGLRVSTGDFVIFLDADDRLLPNAVQSGLDCLRQHPDCGFVFGRYHQMDAEGEISSLPNQPPDEGDYYAALLQRNLIGMQSTVLYPRSSLEYVGGFDQHLRSCEDYDLYLRIAREFPVHRHDNVVAEYRRHDHNMSQNYRFMLEAALRVLKAQVPSVGSDPLYLEALQAGITNWRNHYGNLMVRDFRKNLKKHGFDRSSIRRLGNLGALYLQGVGLLTSNALRHMIHDSFGT